MKKHSVKFLALILVLLGFVQKGTSQHFSVDFENHIRSAQMIAEGEVISQETIVEERTGNIYTVSDFQILKNLKGIDKIFITIRTRGGKFKNRTDDISHGVSLSVGEKSILLLQSVRNRPYFEVKGGKFGKIRYTENSRKFDAIYEGTSETFRSKRELTEKIGNLVSNNFTINPISTEVTFNSIPEVGELCFAIANPEPLYGTYQVAFDILIKSETVGLLFSGSEIVLKYPMSHLGSNIVLNQNIEVFKEIVSESPEYTLEIEDIDPDRLKIKLGSDCRKAEGFYVLGDEYEKLLRVIVNVQDWSNANNSAVLSIEDFDYEGNAQFFIEERGCIDFEKFCTNGILPFMSCTVNTVSTAPFGAGTGQIITITGEDFGSGIGAEITIPNPDDGGATDFDISSIDFNYIESWSDDEIKLVVSSLGSNADESPFGSGIWEIDPDILSQEPNTLVCFTEVQIDFALLNDNDLEKDKMIGLVFNPINSPNGTFQWYLDMDIDSDPILQMKGITFAMVEEVARQAFCDWEDATSVDFEYMGGILNGQNAADNMSVLQFNPISSAGLTAVRFTDNELCPDDEIFEERFREADIELNTNEDWYVSLSENVEAGKLDLYSVLIHEIGHSILLGHAMDTNDSNGTEDERIMFWQLTTQQIKRTIDNETSSGVELLVERSQEAIAPTRCFNGFVLATNTGNCTTSTHEISPSHCNFSLHGNIKGQGTPLKFNTEDKIDFIRVVGINGKIYYNKNDISEGEHDIPTSNLHKGLYFLVTSCEGHNRTQKFVVQ